MYKNILLATDDSENAKRAVKHAIHIAKMNADSTIEMIHIVDPGNTKSNLYHNWDSKETHEEYRKRVQESEKMIKEANIPYKITLLIGFPALEIVEHANKNQFDLVVVGRRGLNVIQQLVAGSVSQRIAKEVKSPVLIVK